MNDTPRTKECLTHTLLGAANRLYMPAEYVRKRAGTNRWAVATRLTKGLKERGYEVAIHPRKFSQWQADYIAELPRRSLCRQVLP